MLRLPPTMPCLKHRTNDAAVLRYQETASRLVISLGCGCTVNMRRA